MDWGLEAVVKGATYDNVAETEWFGFDKVHDYGYGYDISSPSLVFEDGFLKGAKIFDDLDEVYKPFYSGFEGESSSCPVRETLGRSEGCEKSPEISPVMAASGATLVTKYKRRKNQQKRVVEHVTTDGMSTDKWAWRKYGQKPIKGSPYPRSYYRCSSSRDCMARKQLERSTSDPNTFIISYTEDHNHDQPTRRNALAGSTRSKLSSASKSNNKNNSPAASVESGLVESSINSSGENSPAYSGRESDEGKMVNRSDGEEFRFLGFEEMEGLELWWPTTG